MHNTKCTSCLYCDFCLSKDNCYNYASAYESILDAAENEEEKSRSEFYKEWFTYIEEFNC